MRALMMRAGLGGLLCFACPVSGFSLAQEDVAEPIVEASPELTRDDLTPSQRARLDAIEAAGPLRDSNLTPCDAGIHGAPLNAVRENAEGERFEIYDPCGLRFTDLSGVWLFYGRQSILTHDQRTGALEIRLMHVPSTHEYNSVWGYQFADYWYLGELGLTAEAINPIARSRFPTSTRARCPEEWERDVPAHAVRMGYTDDGARRLVFGRARYRVGDDCSISFIENVVDTFVEIAVEETP